ncbi:hypothetical protein B0T26DRAFT_801798, partial [Lasiosphaeria miniovina]
VDEQGRSEVVVVVAGIAVVASKAPVPYLQHTHCPHARGVRLVCESPGRYWYHSQGGRPQESTSRGGQASATIFITVPAHPGQRGEGDCRLGQRCSLEKAPPSILQPNCPGGTLQRQISAIRLHVGAQKVRPAGRPAARRD